MSIQKNEINLHGNNVTEKVAARQSRATAIDSVPFSARFKISDISDITNRKQKMQNLLPVFSPDIRK